MEPLNDRDLDELLTRWEAPDAPRTLEQKVRLGRRGSWWKWLLMGSIRVPVPLTLAVAAALVALFVMPLGRLLIISGIVLILLGAVVLLLGRLHIRLGRLPGDMVWHDKNTTIYFPIVTCLLLSFIGSLLLWLFSRRP